MMRRFGAGVLLASVMCSSCVNTPVSVPAIEAAAGPPACELVSSGVEDAPAIVLNQAGVLPGTDIVAVLNSSEQSSVSWQLLAANGVVIRSGETEVFGEDAASGLPVHRITVEGGIEPGQGYVFKACGGASRAFDAELGLYARLSEDALRYFYHNRIGTPIEARFAGGETWARPAALEGLTATCFSGEDQAGNVWPGCAHELNVDGSWYDAGDFGVYAVNLGISIWTLQNAYERLANRDVLAASGWDDGRIALPETGNGVSELLDEARWGMESLLKLQIPEGAQTAAAPGAQSLGRDRLIEVDVIDAGGLVHHKLAGRQWPPLPIMPEDADQERLLYPPSTAATLSLAATGAQCARLWAGVDDAFSTNCLTAARRAWVAALDHPDILAYSNFDGSGAYGDGNLRDEFAWAAWELYQTTGEEPYLEAFEEISEGAPFSARPDNFGWADKTVLPALSAAQSDQALSDAAREQILAAADAAILIAEQTGYRIPIRPDEYHWGSNSQVANRGIILATAFDLTGDPPYWQGVVDAMDYILGRNGLDQSYVSGYGARSMRAPHHRIWGGAVDAGFPLPPPGALSGGANSTNMSDPVAAQLKGSCAPQLCWSDDVEAYALNEVAINWNAPLVWVSVFLDQTTQTNP